MAESVRIDKLDKNMAAAPVESSPNRAVQWISAHDARFSINGLHWYPEDRLFQRLPARCKGVVRDAVYNLAQHPSGGRIRFKTNTQRLLVKIHTPRLAMMNMCPTGHSGLDIYLGPPGQMRSWQTVRPVYDAFEENRPYESILFEELPDSPRVRELTVYLPTYNSIVDLQFGFDPNATIDPPTPYLYKKPIVFYGTSITQAGCASRPGNGYPSIIERMIGCDTINLGFSGNGMGEPEVARLVAEIDASIFVLDYEANAGLARMRENLHPFCQTLREKHPETPIVIVSKTYRNRVNAIYKVASERDEALKLFNEVADRINREYPGKTTVVDGWTLIDQEAAEFAYVDGAHPNDFGFVKMAEGFAPVLAKLLR